MTVTDILAFWGAILSTSAVVWNAHRDIGNRGKLSISGYIGHLHGNPNKKILLITVTNIGRRPITIINWGTHIPSNSDNGQMHFYMGNELPKTLDESKYVHVVADEYSSLLTNANYLWVQDSTQKTWKMKNKYFKMILRDFNKSK